MSEWDDFMKKVRDRARVIPGEAYRTELKKVRLILIELADHIDPGVEDEAYQPETDAALLLRRAADKLLCAVGSFDFREHLGRKP